MITGATGVGRFRLDARSGDIHVIDKDVDD
jgi:hypothetical protein